MADKIGELLEKFAHWVDMDRRCEYAEGWKKRTGGKIAGYFCSYLPEEVLYAANVLPTRIFSGHDPSVVGLAEPHVVSNISCPFSRACLGEGFKGTYSYFDGLIMAQTCLHTGQMFYIWEKHIPLEWTYFMAIPHSTQNVGRFDYLRAELQVLQDSVENWVGKKIANKDLDRAIEVYNLNRELCRQVYEYRKLPNPLITGEEALDIVMSSQIVDKDEHNQALKELLAELPQRKLDRDPGSRLMIIGSVNDDRQFMHLVENELSLPATIVIEDTCTGLRYFFNDVVNQEDRLMALSIRYNHRPPCPVKDWPRRRRIPYILHLYREYGAQAMIMENMKFCHPHQTDHAFFSDTFREEGIPILFLEFDVTVPVGQFKIRIEALLESLTELVY